MTSNEVEGVDGVVKPVAADTGVTAEEGTQETDSEKEVLIPYIGPPRVIVVEDEPSICRALNIALTRQGFDVTTAQTGEVAVALLQHRKFDLMVLDFRIPDMKGDVICHLAMSYQPHLRHRILFITGDITDRAAKIMEGCNCPVLHKPFELSELIMYLREMYPQQMIATSRVK